MSDLLFLHLHQHLSLVSVSVSVFVPNLRLFPNLHIRVGLHLTLLDIQCFF